jgi:alginate O-acetyltransferase complex protein AlgI
VYIPLGGNRVTVPRHILNLMIVWGLTGLWHGAAWNFVFWGLYYGVLLVIEKYLIGKYIAKAPAWVQHVYAMVIVIIGWVFFSSATLGKAWDTIGMMFGIGAPAFINMHTLYLLRTNILLLIGGSLMSSPKPMEKFRQLEARFPVLGLVCIFSILILSTACLIYSSYNPFLYFRF